MLLEKAEWWVSRGKGAEKTVKAGCLVCLRLTFTTSKHGTKIGRGGTFREVGAVHTIDVALNFHKLSRLRHTTAVRVRAQARGGRRREGRGEARR